MKLFKKYWLSVLAFVMTLVIGSYYTLGGFFSVEKDKVSANVRTVQLSNNEMDYQAILNEFEDSTLTTEGTLTTFTGYQALDPSVFEEIDNLSESDVETLAECKVGYKFTYDTESNVVTIYASMENELGEIEMDTISGVGFINEAGEIDAVMNVDGEGVLLSEMRNAGMIQNCGWFSNFIKKAVKIIVPALVVVAVAAVTVAVCVATAGAAAPALVAAGVASSTAVSVGSAAAGATAGAIFYATVGTAAIQAGVEVGEDLSDAIPDTNVGTNFNEAAGQIVDDTSFSNPLKSIKKLSSSVLSTIKEISEKKIYQFAYLNSGSLIVFPLQMNYIEAYAVLLSSGLINGVALGVLAEDINNMALSTTLVSLVNEIKSRGLKTGTVGIYTFEEVDAAKLAYAAGGFFKNEAQSEIHNNTLGSGYYYHFHDFTHSIHVWYGEKL